jgi:hypothetical protein
LETWGGRKAPIALRIAHKPAPPDAGRAVISFGQNDGRGFFLGSIFSNILQIGALIFGTSIAQIKGLITASSEHIVLGFEKRYVRLFEFRADNEPGDRSLSVSLFLSALILRHNRCVLSLSPGSVREVRGLLTVST